MTSVGTIVWGPITVGEGWTGSGSTALSDVNLNDADNSVAMIFSVPKDGTINKIGFYVANSTGTPPAYNVGLVTLGTDGLPTTSAYGSSAVKSWTPSGTGWTWVTLDTTATGAAGDVVAARVWPGGTPPDGSNFIEIIYSPVVGTDHTLPMAGQYAAAWSRSGGMTAFAIQYNDNSVYGLALDSSTVAQEIEQDTDPDELGCKFTLPAAMTCNGCVMFLSHIDANAPWDAVLYNASDSAIATTSVSDEDIHNAAGMVRLYWDAVNLAASTTYRLVFKPKSDTLGVFPIVLSFENAAAVTGSPLGDVTNWVKTQRADAGSWTDTANDTVLMGLIVSDMTFSTGGGGGSYGYVG